MNKMGRTKETEHTQIKDKIVSNTLYLFLDWFVVTSTGFLFWLIAGKTLLPEEYGIVSTSINFALILSGVSLFGMHAAVWKLIPEYTVKGQKTKIISLVKLSLESVLIFNVVVLLIIFLLSRFISTILKIPLSVFFLSGAILFSYSMVLLFRYVIYGFQNMKTLAVTDFVGQLIKVVVSPILILLGFKYFGPLVGFLFGNIAVILLRIGFIPFREKSTKINKRFIVFNYALPALITMLAWLIFFNGQYVLLTVLKNPQITGLYTVSMTLASILAVIPTTLNSALLPIISQLSVGADTENKRNLLIGLVVRYSLLITLPFALLLIVFSKTAILFFSRAEYLPASQFLPLLVLGSIGYGVGNIFLDNLYAIGQTKIYRNIVVVVSIVFLLLAFPLIYRFSGFGSALAYSITTILWALLSFLYLRKLLHFRLPWKDMMKLLISAAISFVFLNTTLTFSHNVLLQVLFGVLGVLLYLIALVLLRFYSRADIRILDFIIRKSPIFNKQLVNLWNFLSKLINKS